MKKTEYSKNEPQNGSHFDSLFSVFGWKSLRFALK